MNTHVLDINDLHVSVGEKMIVNGVDLAIGKGEVHVLFGPNGSGKSTLLAAIMQLPGYLQSAGRVAVNGTSTEGMTTDAIARLGVGIAFQHPPAIRGVTLKRFLENINRCDDLDTAVTSLRMTPFLERELNVGFSGGELKRAEILKLYAQNPDLLLIDEPESGVDIENISVIAKALKSVLQQERPMKLREKSALIITHTGHILNDIDADVGHVFMDGRIVCSGSPRTIMEDIRRLGFSGCVDCLETQKETQ